MQKIAPVCSQNHAIPWPGAWKLLTKIDKLFAALEQGIQLTWEDVYDFVNPFGDRRGDLFNSVWTFDLDKDILLLMKKDRHCSAPLRLARERLLTFDDFELVSTPKEPLLEDRTLPGPYWEPKLDPIPRERSFLGQVLRDFSYTWRHIIRRQMNTTTFMKLAYAIIWISTMEFTLLERIGFEHISDGGPYVRLLDLPCWETPEATLVPAGSGSSWFVLSQDIWRGLEMVRNHTKSQSPLACSTTDEVIYTILTLRRVVLCRALGEGLVWTQSEKLFDGSPASDTAIDMILWAARASKTEPQQTTINRLPIEIQDRILYHATSSFVASAKLGCELGLGSPFCWVDKGVKIGIAEFKRHRFESSPVESQVILNGFRSGLSYKRESGYEMTHLGRPLPSALEQR